MTPQLRPGLRRLPTRHDGGKRRFRYERVLASATSPEAEIDAIDGADDGCVRSVIAHVEPVPVLVLQPLPEPVARGRARRDTDTPATSEARYV